MASPDYDIVICGGTPFAGLLAGLLHSLHGRRVCLVGDRWSPYRMPHGFDISVMPSARPETWTLLKRGGAETLKLLPGLGRGLFERVDPLFVAETPATAAYLGHMRWLALGTGFSAEKAANHAVTHAGTICRIRDAAMLVGGKAEPGIDAWLDELGVRRLPSAAEIVARRDGGSEVRHDDEAFGAALVVLADDEAVLARLPPAERHRLLTASPSIALATTAATKPLAASPIVWLDRGVVVHQRGGKAHVTAFGAGEADTALPRIGASMPGAGPLHRAAEARFLRVTTTDGAPLIGRMGKDHHTVIAGLGAGAAFLAPLVARHLAGVGSEDEVRYFEARDVAQARTRATVADRPGSSEALL